MAALPKTREGLEAAKYRYSTQGKCRGCPAQIQWYVTPNGSWMPFDMPDEKGEFENHWGTCPGRKSFKRK
jgi:hypothetical protein